MDSSAAAMISLTVPARNGTAEEREPAGQRGVPVVLAMPSARWAQQAGCSADGLRGRLDLCGQISPQPVIVMLQVFDHALKIAHPRPQSGALQYEAIMEIYPLTQQRFRHTNSEEILHACEGRVDTNTDASQDMLPWGVLLESH